MSERREYWANVYGSYVGSQFERRVDAVRVNRTGPTCRVHVCLKPEGAPKRYATERERQKWETNPGFMRGDWLP